MQKANTCFPFTYGASIRRNCVEINVCQDCLVSTLFTLLDEEENFRRSFLAKLHFYASQNQ